MNNSNNDNDNIPVAGFDETICGIVRAFPEEWRHNLFGLLQVTQVTVKEQCPSVGKYLLNK